jgi:hypothetical protein
MYRRFPERTKRISQERAKRYENENRKSLNMPTYKTESEESKAYKAAMAATMNAKLKGKVQKRALMELNEDFTLERTKNVIIRRKQNEMLLAKAREELVEKSLVEKASCLLVCCHASEIHGHAVELRTAFDQFNRC